MKSVNKRFAIDLLWLRVGKVGGSESFIRNLMSGMSQLEDDFHAFLVVACDNKYSFEEYLKDDRFHLIECPIKSSNIIERIFYENFKLSSLLASQGIKKCLEPIYSTPLLGTRQVQYYTVIHDLQALHFPENFSRVKLAYLKYSWKHAIKGSKKIVAISNYTKNDILNRINADSGKIEMIYNPVVVNDVEKSRASEIVAGYGLEPEKFFFCVTSMLPHKNVEVLIDIMKKRQDAYKLAICGVGGNLEDSFIKLVKDAGVEKKIVIAQFIKDEERDALYQECKLFLFPSIFEGFGMPPVEAMMKNKPVITTEMTSIPEVTHGDAIYVKNPTDANEWNSKIDEVVNDIFFTPTVNREFIESTKEYNKENVARRYLKMMFGDDLK